ncbi:MAG: hypothetical protein R2710_13115 [Acidimicrobiales bacterium]
MVTPAAETGRSRSPRERQPIRGESPTSAAVPDRGPLTFVLIPSYLLGPETWHGVGEVLGRLGYESVSTTTTTFRDPIIGPWVDRRRRGQRVGPSPLVLVAHSASCPRLPLVARRLIDRGHDVRALIAVNGRFPWVDGQSPIDADPPLRDLLDGMVRPNDYRRGIAGGAR